MIYNYPYYGFSGGNSFYPPYGYQHVPKAKSSLPKSSSGSNINNKSGCMEFNQKAENCNTKSDKEDNSFFELFGIKLYFDDILLICLIFFLYNEGVKDQYLLIALILLLLS